MICKWAFRWLIMLNIDGFTIKLGNYETLQSAKTNLEEYAEKYFEKEIKTEISLIDGKEEKYLYIFLNETPKENEWKKAEISLEREYAHFVFDRKPKIYPETYCNKCGKRLHEFDHQENWNIHRRLGFGSKYDDCDLDLNLCCDCIDEIIDSCEISPVTDTE